MVWVSHGPKILRCSPEQLRPASLREWFQINPEDDRVPQTSVGGSSTFIDLQSQEPGIAHGRTPAPEPAMPAGPDIPSRPLAHAAGSSGPGSDPQFPELSQPEQELTPQVSRQNSEPIAVDVSALSGVERASNASAPLEAAPVPPADPENIELPEDADDALFEETVFLASEDSGIGCNGQDDLLHITTLLPGVDAETPPLAEDGYPYVTQPLECGEQQAFCLEIPVKAKDLKKWHSEKSLEQMIAIAAAGKRARAEVCLKHLTPPEVELFEVAKQKEIQCWVQTSAIR